MIAQKGCWRIRPARESDAALLSAIERSAARRFRAVPGLEWIADAGVLGEAVHLSCIRGGTCWVVVHDDDAPIGFLSAEAVAERDLHIHEMSVDEAFQGRGIGRALLETAIEWAATHQFAALTLTTFRDVPWNAPFYGRIGFKVLGVSDLDQRLTALLRKEIDEGFAEGMRCAMRLPLDGRRSTPTLVR
jgi:GNAT superfamily N-acetyltransferase